MHVKISTVALFVYEISIFFHFLSFTAMLKMSVWTWESYTMEVTMKYCYCLKDKYHNLEVGLKFIPMVFPYLLLCSYINEIVNDQLSALDLAITPDMGHDGWAFSFI